MRISPLLDGSLVFHLSRERRIRFSVLITFLYLTFGALTLNGQNWTESPVFTFPASLAGAVPSSLVQASDGNFYGMASSTTGTTAPYGFIFQITPGGAFLNVHSFSGGVSDGGGPIGALVIGHDGSLYGATSTGGANGRGTFFSITLGSAIHPPTFTPLFNFGAGSSDPAGVNQLIQGEDGAFYGTSSSGGSAGGGTLFKLSSSGSPPVWSLQALYPTTAYPNVDTIVTPASALLQDSSSYGFFWGASKNGPNYLFKALASTIYNVPGTLPGGGSNFVEDKDYTFYLAFSGTGNSTYPNGGVLKEDHANVTVSAFSGGANGGAPAGGLIMGSDGNLYGTTTTGGAYGFGTIFQMPLSLTTATTIYNFSASDGVASTNLLQGTDARIYGTAYNATSGLGEVYALSASPAIAQAISLSLDSTNISLGSSAHLSWSLPYAASGTSQHCYASVNSPAYAGGWSGRQVGTVSGATYSGGPITLTPTQPGVYTYALTCGGTMTGFTTLNVGPVTISPSSYDFGNVPIGSTAHYTLNINNGGVPLLFSPPVSPNSQTDIAISDNSCTLPPFTSATCSVTFAFSPTIAGAVPVYQVGISAPVGSGISVTPSTFTLNGTGAASNVEKVIYTFPAGTVSPSSLVQAGDGNLYGTAGSSSTGKYGVIYQISPSNNDAYNVAYTFTGGTADGGQPSGPLVIGLDGYLYGFTTIGGANGHGTFFRAVPTNPTTVETLYSFTATDPTSINPIVLGGDGKFYGTSEYGGTSGLGSFFRLSNNGGVWSLASLYSYTGGATDAAYPLGALVEDSQGFFWGTSPGGPIYLYKFLSGGGKLYDVPGPVPGVASNFVEDLNAYFNVAFSGNGNATYPHGGVFQERSGRYMVFPFDGSSQQGGKPVAGLIARTGTNKTGTTTLFYGTTQQGGSNGYGTVFQMDALNGAISTLYNLTSSDGISSTNLLQTSQMVKPDGTAVAVYGAFYAVTSTRILKITPEPISAGPVTLSANTTNLKLGSSLQLNWQTDGAFSQTAQQCIATVQSTTGGVVNDPAWSGVQHGTLTSGVYSGSANITPTITGDFFYGLTCDGVNSSVVFVRVDQPAIVESIQGQYFVTNLDANTHSFGALPVGTPSSPWQITLTNTASSTVLLSFTSSGDLTDYSADTSTCNSLAPQATCSLSFVYTPSNSGQPTSFVLHVTTNNSQVGVTFGGGASDEAQTDGSLINLAGSGATACVPTGPKTVFAGGVDNLSTDADLSNVKTLQSYGNTSVYVHSSGILRSRGQNQTNEIVSTFAATGPGILELYVSGIPGIQSPSNYPAYNPYAAGDIPSTWAPKIGTLNLSGNACAIDNHKYVGTPGQAIVMEQDAMVVQAYFKAHGGQYLLPFITPNCEYPPPSNPEDWATSADWAYARDLVQKLGGIAIDDPANYFDTAQGDTYRKWVSDVIRWCNQNGLVSMVVMSPYDTKTNNTHAFDADFLGTPTVGGVIGKGVEGEVTYLQSVDALPTLWAIENYSFEDKIDNQIGSDSDSTGLTINYVATWVAQHATTSPMPAGVVDATSCKP